MDSASLYLFDLFKFLHFNSSIAICKEWHVYKSTPVNFTPNKLKQTYFKSRLLMIKKNSIRLSQIYSTQLIYNLHYFRQRIFIESSDLWLATAHKLVSPGKQTACGACGRTLSVVKALANHTSSSWGREMEGGGHKGGESRTKIILRKKSGPEKMDGQKVENESYRHLEKR